MNRLLPLLGALVTAWVVVPRDPGGAGTAAAVITESGDDAQNPAPDRTDPPPALAVDRATDPAGRGAVIELDTTRPVSAGPALTAPLVVAPKTSPPARS